MNKTRSEGFRKTILLEKQKNFFFSISSTGPVIVTEFTALCLAVNFVTMQWFPISNASQRESIGSQWALVEKVAALKGKFLRVLVYVSII